MTELDKTGLEAAHRAYDDAPHREHREALYDAISAYLSSTSAGVTEEQTPRVTCQTCNGHGMIGALMPWGGGQVDSVCEPCPDCSPSRVAPVSLKEADDDLCPICSVPFKIGDNCATDIELGECHAECLEGSPVVDLETGEPSDGPIDIYPYEPDLHAVRLERLCHAVEGECDGLAISNEQAAAILEYVDEASPAPAPAGEPVGIKALLAEIERLQFALRQAPSVSHFHILAEAMAEVKATSDGKSDQAIADIVSGCIEEIAALHFSPTPVSAPVGVVEDGEEDDNLIEGVAKAIALHGIGRGWDDFEEVNAYDFDRVGLREYARAAIYASPLTDILPARSPAVEGK